jgi:GT2 family glycosyltransferase
MSKIVVSPMNGISIIIPCAGRVHLLENLLQTVQRARVQFPHPSETLLLDNSKPSDQEMIHGLAAAYDAVYRSGSHNISQKRNQGAELASYDLILFLDSDCIVDENILSEHFAAYTAANTGSCLGLLLFTGEDTTTWLSVERTGVLSCFYLAAEQEETNWGPTANISFRRDAFLEIGGFDPAFSRPGGEDVDLGFRLSNAGWRIYCNPKALVYHSKETWSSFWQVYERFLRYGAADALLIKKHASRTITDFPMSMQYTVLLIVVSLLYVPSYGLWGLLLPFLWTGLTFIVYPLLPGKKESRDQQDRWLVRALELILFTALDFGRLLGGIKFCEKRAFYTRIIFFDGQLALDWPGVVRSALASAVSLFLSLLLFQLLFALIR